MATHAPITGAPSGAPSIEMLAPFPADEVRIPLGGVEIGLWNMMTLIESIREAADLASTFIDQCSVSATREKLNRIVNLCSITLEERERTQAAFYAGDDVLNAHIIGRAA